MFLYADDDKGRYGGIGWFNEIYFHVMYVSEPVFENFEVFLCV